MDERKDGWTDGITHTRTDDGHYYSPHPPTSGKNKLKKKQLLLLFSIRVAE